MADVTLAIRDVEQSYGKVHALRGVNLDIPQGTTVALLGPSGCGKSTLLRVLAGLEAPDQGTIRLGEEDLTRIPPERRGVGMVFQDFALFPHLSVAQNVAFGLVEQGWSRSDRDARVGELLSLMSLEGLADRRPHALSGGQQQRVALARALAPRPSLLLLDEPLSNLDRNLRDELTVELSTLLSDLSLRALHVTHDQREAFALADQVAIMREGRILQVAPAERLHAAPHDAWVASFLGLREIVPESVARELGFAGPVLLRVERFKPNPEGAPFTVRGLTWVEHDLEYQLRTPAWPFDIRYRIRPRELPSPPPGIGDVLHLEVPDDAWTLLEVRA